MDCSICFDEVNQDIETLNCGHVFHHSCMNHWQENTCPMCRQPIVVEENARELAYIRMFLKAFGNSPIGEENVNSIRDILQMMIAREISPETMTIWGNLFEETTNQLIATGVFQ